MEKIPGHNVAEAYSDIFKSSIFWAQTANHMQRRGTTRECDHLIKAISCLQLLSVFVFLSCVPSSAQNYGQQQSAPYIAPQALPSNQQPQRYYRRYPSNSFGTARSPAPPANRAQTNNVNPEAALVATSTLPSATDPRIIEFNQPHMSWLPAAAPRNQLLLFLPGTNGVPRADFPFAQLASTLGYHAIFLMYPDEDAAQKVCSRSDDANAYIKFRLAVIQGGNYDSIRVSTADSIENRLAKLLSYLAMHQPNQGWDQYLRDGQINWQKLVVSGHSQGGGHAYVISKIHEVARVIMFGSPKDYSFYFNRPAGGFDSNVKTPLQRYFAFNHTADTAGGCDYNREMEILRQIGLTRLGTTEVNSAAADPHHAHLIFTSEPLAEQSNPMQFHSSVINGRLPSCRTVWTYMLSEPVP